VLTRGDKSIETTDVGVKFGRSLILADADTPGGFPGSGTFTRMDLEEGTELIGVRDFVVRLELDIGVQEEGFLNCFREGCECIRRFSRDSPFFPVNRNLGFNADGWRLRIR